LHHFNPNQVVLVHTGRTAKLAERIGKLIGPTALTPFCKTDAYRVDTIIAGIHRYVDEHLSPETDLLFNLTGGTKTMEFAAFEVARQRCAKAFYYQTEARQSLIHPYHFEAGKLICDPVIPIETTLSIDQFLRLYVTEYQRGDFKNDFERTVYAALRGLGPDYEVYPNLILTGVGPNVEVDWVLRYRNTFAVGEVKLHATKTAGIDQLNGVTDQRTLGTYTRKFLISVDEFHPNDLALAEAYRIKTIHLPSGRSDSLSGEDVTKLTTTIQAVMEPKY
jgi:hypothetical protein